MYGALERAVKILGEHQDLPDYVSVAVNGDGVWIIPWTHGAPVTALLGWVEIMGSDRQIRAHIFQDMTSIEVEGTVDNVRFHATASTHRMVHLFSGDHVSLDELRRISTEEEAYA